MIKNNLVLLCLCCFEFKQFNAEPNNEYDDDLQETQNRLHKINEVVKYLQAKHPEQSFEIEVKFKTDHQNLETTRKNIEKTRKRLYKQNHKKRSKFPRNNHQEIEDFTSMIDKTSSVDDRLAKKANEHDHRNLMENFLKTLHTWMESQNNYNLDIQRRVGENNNKDTKKADPKSKADVISEDEEKGKGDGNENNAISTPANSLSASPPPVPLPTLGGSIKTFMDEIKQFLDPSHDSSHGGMFSGNPDDPVQLKDLWYAAAAAKCNDEESEMLKKQASTFHIKMISKCKEDETKARKSNDGAEGDLSEKVLQKLKSVLLSDVSSTKEDSDESRIVRQ